MFVSSLSSGGKKLPLFFYDQEKVPFFGRERCVFVLEKNRLWTHSERSRFHTPHKAREGSRIIFWTRRHTTSASQQQPKRTHTTRSLSPQKQIMKPSALALALLASRISSSAGQVGGGGAVPRYEKISLLRGGDPAAFASSSSSLSNTGCYPGPVSCLELSLFKECEAAVVYCQWCEDQ